MNIARTRRISPKKNTGAEMKIYQIKKKRSRGFEKKMKKDSNF